MRIVHVNTYDAFGGAARSALRVHQALVHAGADSLMFVRDKRIDDVRVTTPPLPGQHSYALARAALSALATSAYRNRTGDYFTAPILPERIAASVRALAPDIVHLHWIAEGFVTPEFVGRVRAPVVWTLHDTFPFTGGCHYPGNCTGYQASCGRCPQLGSKTSVDLSRLVWRRKDRAWRSQALTIVAPSRWMAECARASSLFRNRRITVVPSGIDTSSFRPLPQKEARAILGIAPDRKCVLFAAMNGARNPIKGFKYLSEALRILARDGKATRLELLVLGDSSIPDPKSLGVPVRCLGHLGDDLTIAMIHAASDVFVAPSVQENLANTVIEALACGRPAVAFRVGGMPDMIHHQVNGALADPLDPLSLAREIDWVLADEARWSVLSARAREIAVQTHSLDLHARRYLDLYEETVHGDSDAAAQRLST